MNTGPNDKYIKIEIDEVGVEGLLESLIPGSEGEDTIPAKKEEHETESSGIDDPFGW